MRNILSHYFSLNPTAEQKKRLRSFIGVVGGNVDADFMDENYNTAHSASYEGVSPARVLSGITNFYDEGIKPKGNVSYSISLDNVPQTEEVDEYGNHFVLSSDNTPVFGVIDENSGLKYAPIKLSMGSNYLDDEGRNRGYGLLHIKAQRGDEIRKAGYDSVQDFVESVARNYKLIRRGGVVAGNQTYLLELEDEYNNTLYIQLSNNKEYWTINSAGIFRKKYSHKKEKVYDRLALSPDTNTDISGVDSSFVDGVTAPARNSPLTSVNKDITINPKNQISEQESHSLSRERADIESKAKADGTWLKAPNGKETNLSPEQWVAVRTKAFKEWFGDWDNDPENASKVVDANGNKFAWSEHRNKNILLIYGGLGCMGRSGRRELATLREEYAEDNLAIVVYYSVSSLEELKEFRNQYSDDYIFISELMPDYSPFKIKYGVQSTPTCFVIDRSGTIVLKTVGFDVEQVKEKVDN